MIVISKKSVAYVVSMIILGVCRNRLVSVGAGLLGIPLYLDSIGTMFAAVVGGLFPGMFVGFITNVLGGFSDSTTFYYGTINVLIALIAGLAAERGFFQKYVRVVALIPFYLLLSVPCSVLSYILFDRQIADNVATPAVTMFYNLGLPVLLSQILGDFCVEIPDKLISLTVAFLLIRLVPARVRRTFRYISGNTVEKTEKGEREQASSLGIQVAEVLLLYGFAIVAVAFAISYKTYMESRVAGYPGGNYDIHQLRVETLLYSGKMLSAVLGLLLCIISFSIVLSNKVVVSPLFKMTKEMRRFAYDSDTGRHKSVSKIQSLDIHTENEIEELYHALSKTVKEIDEYIDKTNKQSKTISDLHVNIITTLADIVESRDETTGNHVKRTAEYAKILARKLKKEGKYKDEISGEYINTLTIAAPLHDIGKIKIPDAILNKPARLTDEEYETIKTHTTLGGIMLDDAVNTMGRTEYLHMAKDIAVYHHEWWDGSSKGYPEHLSGEDIPLSARIMAVADVLDALLSKRPYKDGLPLDQAFAIMKKESGTHFDPEIIMAMEGCRDRIIDVMERYSDE
ncbi:MAG: HD domain-containing protein [Lachnospiraceae bacterium]|nr:HD domain-containing protein [Lachnospiraceae bacterium]